MSLALHGHHVLILATLAFAAAVLIPFWYTSPNLQTTRNVFQICYATRCYWTLVSTGDTQSVSTILPVLVASVAIACVGTSLIALILSSWYIQRFARDIASKWLLILTIIVVFFSFLFSCGVWSIMLTTNLHQNDTYIKTVRLEDFGFAFWINIGSSGAYLYGLFIYLFALCQCS